MHRRALNISAAIARPPACRRSAARRTQSRRSRQHSGWRGSRRLDPGRTISRLCGHREVVFFGLGFETTMPSSE
jgi:hypothetical protein